MGHTALAVEKPFISGLLCFLSAKSSPHRLPISSIDSAMGGGNGQKAKMARERNLEKQKGAKGSQLDSNKKAMTIQCKVCMQTFICTTSEVKCREHAEAKHPKSDVFSCFPHLQK
ncbi:uncharacterized protein At2g23090-like [Cucurbita pepo subsp. pepo]|nr:uncharacterized protein At2g23090-like [Cucurbita pepo subsp. pepo]